MIRQSGLLLLLMLSLVSCRAASATVFIVAPDGKPGAAGTPQAPLAGVQEALDRARAGDTVRLRPGVYRERVAFRHSGTYGKPITLEGEPGAILDGSDPITPQWQPAPDIAPGVYRAPMTLPVFTLTAEGKIVTMLDERRTDPATAKPGWHWPNLFRDGVGPSKWEGVKALAMHRPGRNELLIRFQGDLDPRRMAITVAPRRPCVTINGADRCVVRGLTLRNAAYGVLIESSVGSVVEHCFIGPVDFGVWLDSGSDRCTVRYNEMTMDPYAGADPKGVGAWDNWQAHKVGGFYDRFGVQIHRTLGGHEVHDNYIHDTWGGVEDRGRAGENRGLRIHHNRILRINDDGLEPNGAEEDCQWYENVVERCLCGFRIKAPTVGPLYAYRNIFFDNGEDFRNYGEVELKPATVFIYHNTSTSRPAIQSNKVYGIGTPNYHYFNNLFWCTGWWGNTGPSVEPNWKGDYNVYVRREERPFWETGRALAEKLGLDRNSRWVTGAEPGFRDLEKRDVSLTADSPARGAGADLSRFFGKPLPGCEPGYFQGKAPDAGALPFGAPMPKVPRRPEEVKVPPAGTWPGPEARSMDPYAGKNLLANGSFEEGLREWAGPAAAFQARKGDAIDGEHYLAVTVETQAGALSRKVTGLTPGKGYILAYQSRQSTFGDLRVIVRNPANGAYLVVSGAGAAPYWQRTLLHFTAPGPEVSLEISPRTPGACALDHFALCERP